MSLKIDDRISNFIKMFINTFLGKFISILTIGIISRNIIVTDKGIYDYYSVIVSYIILFINFGFELYFMDLVINRGISSKYLFSVQVKSRGLVSLFIFIITFLNLVIVGKVFTSSLWLLILMMKLFSYTFDLSWNLKSEEKFDKIAKYEISNSIIKLVLVLLIIKGNNIIGLIFIDVILDYRLKLKIYFNYKYKLIRTVKYKDILKIVKKSFIINLSTFMISIYYSVDTLMLGLFRNSSEVAIYTGAYTFLALAIIPTNILYQIYSPYLIKNKWNKKVLKTFIGLTSILGICVFVVSISIGPYMIRLVMGNQYYKSAELFKILSIDLIPCYLAGAFANPINAWGKYDSYFKIVMISGISNIIGNLILIPSYGYYGAVMTTIFSEGIVFIMSLFWWINKKRVGEKYEGITST